MKRLSVILLSFLLYLPLYAQFRGTVYIDTDQSGTFDKGDKPLAGVMVTDGMNVVKTNKKGRFSLPGFEKTRFISMTTADRKRTDPTERAFFRSNHRYGSNRRNGTLGN